MVTLQLCHEVCWSVAAKGVCEQCAACSLIKTPTSPCQTNQTTVTTTVTTLATFKMLAAMMKEKTCRKTQKGTVLAESFVLGRAMSDLARPQHHCPDIE